MNKVLIITYYWPPASGPGVQRFLKICKYLRMFEWEPIVLTVRNGSYPSFDETLIHDIPDNLSVYKTQTCEPFTLFNKFSGKKGRDSSVGFINMNQKKSLFQRIAFFIRANFFIPDARIGWKSFALRQAYRIIKKEQIDAVITTGPPHSTHLIGHKLKYKFHLPWIADFRDPWTTVYYNEIFPRTKFTEKLDYHLESKVLRESDLVTVVSHGLKEEYMGRAQRLEIIYNGYDEEDVIHSATEKSNIFTLSYIGNLKPNQNITMLWEALNELKKEINHFSQLFRLRFIGNIDNQILEDVNHNNLQDITETKSFVPHREATKLMSASNMLLFIVPFVTNNRLIITGKLFEYIASQTPILSIGPTGGNAAKILSESGRDDMITYDDKEQCKQLIKQYFQEWIKIEYQLKKHSNQNIEKYSRRYLTKLLSNYLNQLNYEYQKN